MSDDWSLKGKILISEVDTWDDEVHLKEDIDTLRKKLIDDITERLSTECGTCGQSVISNKEISQIINKRFGVDG